MAQAIAFVLRERGFRAGASGRVPVVRRLGRKDGPLRRGEVRGERTRLRGATRTSSASIGTFNSPCAVAALPELNRAPGGPLAMVSPLNSFVGLTRARPGRRPGAARGAVPDRSAQLRSRLSRPTTSRAPRSPCSRASAVTDGCSCSTTATPGYGALMATGFETAARRLGLAVAGRATWDPQATRLRGSLRRAIAAVARERRLRRRPARHECRPGRRRPPHPSRGVGRSARRRRPDAAVAARQTVWRGRARRCTSASRASSPSACLRPVRAFVERFGRDPARRRDQPAAVYAAQAAEVLLDAIARSDGTRASVIEELFRTRVRAACSGRSASTRTATSREPRSRSCGSAPVGAPTGSEAWRAA